MKNHNKLYHDCDGVLADFDSLATDIFGEPPTEAEARLGEKGFWETLRVYRHPDTGYGFFRSLPLMPDGRALWDATKHLNPTILTGCPFGNWAPEQKIEWAAEHFPGTRIVTCMAREKIVHLERPGDILVDDRAKYQSIWEKGGGQFVHHTDTASTLHKLRELRPEWGI